MQPQAKRPLISIYENDKRRNLKPLLGDLHFGLMAFKAKPDRHSLHSIVKVCLVASMLADRAPRLMNRIQDADKVKRYLDGGMGLLDNLLVRFSGHPVEWKCSMSEIQAIEITVAIVDFILNTADHDELIFAQRRTIRAVSR